MVDVHLPAVLAATVAAFILSSVWYIVFDTRGAVAAGDATPVDAARPPAWKMLVELVRSLVVAVVLARLVGQLGIAGVGSAVLLAVVLWVAFPLVLLTGSVIWEGVAPRTATVHAGDWLAKLVLIAVVVTPWR